MKKLVLFDMDGTLFDTSEVNYLSYKNAAAKYGYRITRNEFMIEFIGKNYKDFLPVFGINNNEKMTLIHEEKKKIYPEYLKYVRVNNFLLDIIYGLPDKYIKALVTTASKKNVMDILNAVGLTEVFDFMITQEDSVKLKPDPEAYIMAMKKAKIDPKDTTIFEDSKVGIQAAEATGAAVIQIRRF